LSVGAVDTVVSDVESALFTLREISRRLNVPIKTLARLAERGTIAPDFSCTAAKLFRPSRLDEIRAAISTAGTSREKVVLARQARELRGTMFELDSTSPDLESVRKRIDETKDPREKAILARYARGLRKNQSTKSK
jgi:hypothetical protein